MRDRRLTIERARVVFRCVLVAGIVLAAALLAGCGKKSGNNTTAVTNTPTPTVP